MLSTGITRPMDQLGRIVLPIELRRTLGISPGDGLEIFVDRDMILFRKYALGCVFCGESTEDLAYFHGKQVCGNCRDQLTRT